MVPSFDPTTANDEVLDRAYRLQHGAGRELLAAVTGQARAIGLRTPSGRPGAGTGRVLRLD